MSCPPLLLEPPEASMLCASVRPEFDASPAVK
jgi:hypothetical protein